MPRSLDRYHQRRRAGRTPEPQGGRRRSRGGRRFVIQKHDATRLHYDLRLEVDGALVSWAVPKGPSTDPSERRLAVRTEDHPLDYADFEGVIPRGEYGAGPVLIWDRGPYRNLRASGNAPCSMEDALDAGLVEVWLEGEKLRGGFALKRIEDGDDEQWLLIKMDDEHADARRNPTSTEPRSVASGRDLDDIEAAHSDEDGDGR